MQTKRLKVDRRLGVSADADMILAEKPSIVVIATGGLSNTEQVPAWGVDKGLAVSAWDILTEKVALQKNVLLYDTIGTHAGFGTADFMASRGSQVEIVTPDVKVADDVGGTTFPIFYRRLYAQGMIATPNFWLDSIYQEGDKKIAVLRNEYTEVLEEREVDQVVIENGITPNTAVYWTLKERSKNRGQTDIASLFDAKPQPALAEKLAEGEFLMFRVGDCVSQHNIHGAIYDALRLCKDF
jgi:NADPH-dependent 2,4-dienoyl-CoA reductase/sulfur reductase-like enzyme